MSSTETSAATQSDLSDTLGPALASALAKKGYTTLTPVQKSVLNPELRGADLRISSQTGSGKTLAIGFVLRDAVCNAEQGSSTGPRALVIVPTRELAKQVQEELAWLYAPLKLRIASVTGGASYRDEHRALAQGPAIVVGTPGRLFDHLSRGSIDASSVAAVVLDEADHMLDLGFRNELDGIFGHLPEQRQSHLVSATFPREVLTLANRVQRDAVRVEGTPLGTANADIDHVIHLVLPRERLDALINLLLDSPEEQTLIFARTRADVADIAEHLQQSGFSVGSLSGDMDQPARHRALSGFKRGELRALVATDVAARGIDVNDVARVIQLDAPGDVDTYTHRSGRTGRAGRKGKSLLLIPPVALGRASALLERARVRFRIEPIPSAESIRKAQDERWFAELTRESEAPLSPRLRAQIKRIVDAGLSERALTILLERDQKALGEPREITPVREREPRRFQRPSPNARAYEARDTLRTGPDQWVPFRVTWGEAQGADARRLVAMLCRRGNIRGSDIGAIRINRSFSSVDVRTQVAREFARATRDPDPRDPRVSVSPMATGAAMSSGGGAAPPKRRHKK